jgi:hypothetical protein
MLANINPKTLLNSEFRLEYSNPTNTHLNYVHVSTGAHVSIIKKVKFTVWILKGLSQIKYTLSSIDEAATILNSINIKKELEF